MSHANIEVHVSYRPAPPAPDEDDDTLVMASPPIFTMPPRAAASSRSSCDDVAEELAVAIDGILPLELELHLEGCRACAERLRAASALSERVRRAADGYSHANDFEARVLAAIGGAGAR